MRTTIFTAILFVSIMQSPASAQTDQERARAAFSDGEAHVAVEEYGPAHEDFETGYVLSRRPLFLYNMAECSFLGGHHAVARREYERYLEAEPDGSRAAAARARIDELQPAVDLQVRAPVEEPDLDPQGLSEDPAARRPLARDWRLWTVVSAVVLAGVASGVGIAMSRSGSSECNAGCFMIERNGT